MRGMRRFAWMAAAAICAAVPSLAAEGQASLRSCGMRSVCGLSGISARDSLRTSVPADRRFLPTSRRIDRGINDICYAYKGEMAIGFAASYGTLTSDDTDLMLILDGIDMKGSVFTLNPSFGYFIKDNICLGVRFGYTRTQGTLGHVSLNLGSANDISMSLSDVGFKNRMTTMGAFMRSYAGVDPKGHFGLFGELELMFRMGTSVFSYAPEGGRQEYRRQQHAGTHSLQLGRRGLHISQCVLYAVIRVGRFPVQQSEPEGCCGQCDGQPAGLEAVVAPEPRRYQDRFEFPSLELRSE